MSCNKDSCPFTQACLIRLGCYDKTTNWVAFIQQKFVSHSSGDWEVQEQVTSRFAVYWGSASLFINGAFLLCLHMLEGWPRQF
jgi:hypothetical protein